MNKYDLIKNIYRKIQKKYSAIYTDRANYVIDNIVRINNILVLGARDDFLRQIVYKTDNELSYYLVDKQPSELSAHNLHYLFSDLNNSIPFEDDFFDCIVSDQLIEHLMNPDRFLKEVSRVGKKGSRIIIGSENLAAWHNIIALILAMHPFSDHYSETRRVGNPFSIHHQKKIMDPYMRHCKVPTVKALAELMTLNKMVISEIKGFGHLLPYGTRWDKLHSIQFVIVAEVKK